MAPRINIRRHRRVWIGRSTCCRNARTTLVASASSWVSNYTHRSTNGRSGGYSKGSCFSAVSVSLVGKGNGIATGSQLVYIYTNRTNSRGSVATCCPRPSYGVRTHTTQPLNGSCSGGGSRCRTVGRGITYRQLQSSGSWVDCKIGNGRATCLIIGNTYRVRASR